MNFHKRELKNIKPKRKNKAPEKEMIEKIKAKCFELSLCVSVIEAKAVWNRHANNYVKGQVEPGYPDISGNDNDGLALYIEVKAKNRRCNLKDHQRKFLEKKIKSNCFAVVVDSPDKLSFFYKTFKKLRHDGKIVKARKFLMDMLPKKRTAKPDGLEF